MKKTNFMMAFALAAVTLFATSCSEESLDITQGSINQETIVLPDPTASISVSVVDLEGGKLVGGVTTVKATDFIGKTMTVECPANEGYTTAAAVEVAVPELAKGQSINIPVTFYVVSLGTALENFMEGVTPTITPLEGEDAVVTEKALSIADAIKKEENKEEGWILNEDGTISYENNTDNNLVAFMDAPVFFYDAMEGYEFVREVEEAVESKAAETTLLDLIKTKKFGVYQGAESWDIASWSIFTIKKFAQKFYLAQIKLENKEMGESVEFIANVAGEVSFSTEAKEIELDHNNGHDNSHNGHGHGNGNNAGGGIGGNEGE